MVTEYRPHLLNIEAKMRKETRALSDLRKELYDLTLHNAAYASDLSLSQKSMMDLQLLYARVSEALAYGSDCVASISLALELTEEQER